MAAVSRESESATRRYEYMEGPSIFIQLQLLLSLSPLLAPHTSLPTTLGECPQEHEETDSTKPYMEHTNRVQEDNSIGAKAGKGVSYVILTLVTYMGPVCSLDTSV
jgi:hypothetical protein